MVAPVGRRLLETYLEQLIRGDLPRNETTEAIARAFTAVLAEIMTADQALGLVAAVGRPKKTAETLTTGERKAGAFMIGEIVAGSTRDEALERAEGMCFEGEPFSRRTLERILALLWRRVRLSDEWRLRQQESEKLEQKD